MFLSRLILNPRSRSARRDIARPYEMHRTLMRAFPDEADGGAERVLWRLDTERHSGRLTLYVQSQDKPNWSFLGPPDDYLLDPHDLGLDNPAAKPFAPAFREGQVLAFRLRANPTVKRDGKRLGLFGEDDQRDWLARKGEQDGFQPLRVTIVPEGMVTDKKRRNDRERKITLYAVRFDGHLRITEHQTFRQGLAAGIGPAKALGFGLLSLARP